MHPQNEILTGIKQTIFTKFIRVYLVYKLLEHEVLAYPTRKEDPGLLENLAFVNWFTFCKLFILLIAELLKFS